jgi:hypothetical protein
MSKDDVIRKMALAIKATIDAADNFRNPHLTGEKPVCILPKELRYDLGDALDALKEME